MMTKSAFTTDNVKAFYAVHTTVLTFLLLGD